MANVNGGTLMMAVQAIHSTIESLKKEREEVAGHEDEVDIIELLLSYSKAADALEEAYREELNKVDNLPPYESLIKK